MIRNMMKIACMCACAVVVFAFAVSVRAEGICTKKIAELERQLSIAKQHKNTGRAAGLERALENAVSYTHLDVYKRQVKDGVPGAFRPPVGSCCPLKFAVVAYIAVLS